MKMAVTEETKVTSENGKWERQTTATLQQAQQSTATGQLPIDWNGSGNGGGGTENQDKDKLAGRRRENHNRVHKAAGVAGVQKGRTWDTGMGRQAELVCLGCTLTGSWMLIDRGVPISAQ